MPWRYSFPFKLTSRTKERVVLQLRASGFTVVSSADSEFVIAELLTATDRELVFKGITAEVVLIREER